MDSQLRNEMVALLVETGQAHHKAFEATDGADQDWSIWYAGFMQDKLADRFGMVFSKSKLIYCLMRADIEHQARAPDSEWAEFYANEMVQCYAPSESPAKDTLALYLYEGCPFCIMVLSAIEQLGIDVELRNIFDNPEFRDELVAARGRTTVPVLRITGSGGKERWMPESRDIVSYLQQTYG